MRVFATIAAVLGAVAATASPAQAGLVEKLAACAAIADDSARLACFDDLVKANADGPALSAEAAAALKQEFRFDRGLMTGPFTFRLVVSGDLSISRATAAAREVERVVRRVAKALGDGDSWGIAVTVHGAKVALSRGHPYSGAELLAQAQTGMARTGLAKERYTVSQGADAAPLLWDDGRLRSENEHIIIEVVDLGTPLTR